MTVTEACALILALASLGVSWRAYLLSKQATKAQVETYRLSEVDLRAKQEPKLQVSNEFYWSTWQRFPDEPHCDPKDLELTYSALLTNKGESVSTIDSVVIELGASEDLLGNPSSGIGVNVSGSLYLAANESVVLNATVTAQHMELVREFFQIQRGVIVSTLVFRYAGYSGLTRCHRAEIYRLNKQGGIVSKGNYDAARTSPRSYLLKPTESSAA